MTQTYGNYIEFSKPIDPDKVPQMFKAAYGPLLAGIKRRGGKPLPETIRICILDAVGDQLPGRFGLHMDADYTNKSKLEAMNDEWETGGKGGGKKG